MLCEFKPDIQNVGRVKATASIEQIESEPMLHGASPEFAHRVGGPLTRSILEIIERQLDSSKHYVIDTKSVMLMPGMYPSIPGWHCDAVIREHQFAQPDLNKLNSNVKNWTALVSSHYDGTSNTEYVMDDLILSYKEDRVWSSISESVEKIKPHTIIQPDGDIWCFAQPTLHRATKTNNKGWRFFFRLSEYHMPAINKIRHQVQVYTTENNGW